MDNNGSKYEYELKKETIESISEENLKPLTMPVPHIISEAETLYETSLLDKDILTEKTDLDWSIVDELPVRSGALRYLQATWLNQFQRLSGNRKDWLDAAPAGFDLRDDLIHQFNYAYREAPDQLEKVKIIADGDTNDDLIQELMDLAVLGKAHPEPLEKLGLDLSILDKAENMSDELADILAKVNGSRADTHPLRILRDKAYIHLKEAMDIVRMAGQYAFWKDDTRKRLYTSSYVRRKNNLRKSKTEESTTQNAE